jgi:hypothetical protein
VFLFGPELEILDTPEFQRLAGIKQLGTSYFVFRGAVHTRFEHALGAIAMAQKMIDAVNRNPYAQRIINDREMRLIRLFALLHDLPHIPFGHTLEDEFGLLTRHDRNPARIDALLWSSEIGAILRNALADDEYKVLRRMIAAVGDDEIAKLGRDAFLVDIVANTVCADAIDYVQRDLEACGMPVELGDRFLDFFVITGDDSPQAVNRHRMALVLDKRGMPRPDVESEVVKLLSYRYELAERVYFHHAKNAASVMIGRAVQGLGLHHRDENFHFLSDDVLLALLAKPELAEPLGIDVNAGEDQVKLATEIGALLARRRLYKIGYLGVADDFAHRIEDVYLRWGQPEARRDFEDRLARLAGVPEGHVLVHLPPSKMAVKLAEVRVATTGGVIVRLQDWDDAHSRRVSGINEAHRRLWRVAVYCHPSMTSAQRRLVLRAAEDQFGVPSRYVEDDSGRGYLEQLFDELASEQGWTIDDRVALAGKAKAELQAYESREGAEELIKGLVEARRATAESDSGRSEHPKAESHPGVLPGFSGGDGDS